MPLYDFQCNNCEHVFERLQNANDPSPECPVCTCKQVTRLIGSPAALAHGDETAQRVEKEIKSRLARGRARDALSLARKAEKLAGNKKGMGKIKAAGDRLAKNLEKNNR